MLTRILQPFDMETFKEYVERILFVRERLVEHNPNYNGEITTGGQFNGFDVVANNISTFESITQAYHNYCEQF